MIEVTGEMVEAFEREGTGGYGDITDTRAGLAAVLAIVERDRCMARRGHVFHPLAKPVVHLLTAGDEHMHCCGQEIAELPNRDRTTLDPHGVTCRGPS